MRKNCILFFYGKLVYETFFRYYLFVEFNPVASFSRALYAIIFTITRSRIYRRIIYSYQMLILYARQTRVCSHLKLRAVNKRTSRGTPGDRHVFHYTR